MKRSLLIFMLAVMFACTVEAKGSFSSGGGSHTSSSSSKGSFSSTTASNKPLYLPPSSTAPKQQPNIPRTTTTTTTTINRTYSTRYVSSAGYYGSWGTGYHYNNGLMTGLIIGNMMHPYGTIMYAGPGMYNNNAVLYPDGRVVNQQGYVVGNFINGQFIPIQNGAMAAQPVPQDAANASVNEDGESNTKIFFMTIIIALIIGMMFMIFNRFKRSF